MRRVGCARAASALPCVGHVSGPTLSGPQFFAAPCVAVPASSYGYSDDSDDEAKEIISILKGTRSPRTGQHLQFDPIVTYGYSEMLEGSTLDRRDFRSNGEVGRPNGIVASEVNSPLRKYMSRTHAAEALRRAIHLARGDGLLDDAEDTEQWQGSVPNKDEARGDVIYWGSDRALIFGDSTDSFATYGRCPAQGPTLTLGKTEAMVKYAGSWDKHIHVGVKSHVPKAPVSKVVSAAEEWVLTEPSYPYFREPEPSGTASTQ